MRKNMKILSAAIVAASLLAGVGYYQTAMADSSTTSPGSTNDPIVTKSYVDQKISEALGTGTGADSGTSSSKLEVVTVPIGKKLIVEDGGEVIVRAGKAIAYSPDVNGLSDLTDGLDIAPGKAVANNHLILFPRAGRGVEADPAQKNGLTVLVRGKYNIQ
ncbi:hypothetical protein [Cohnella thailandensis]|uniref:Copper amine oxidase-like N-terminal domain-containing protein n=1 Tax=Cohnella thailandensis TaxID=557557 RepID=A0A841T138_9BACL|nr:hypothetical protein [Cohnella thailandensis]MBB6638133.1 hypothetical protein [Cohnella thailandensis]MBP1971940.1 hypothetical protein [Cohnella thailandensis]